MRRYTAELLNSVLCVLIVCFMFAVACSWDIITRGEVQTSEQAALEDLEILEASKLESLPGDPLDEDIPDSLTFKLFSEIVIGGVTYDFVEMEVGELLDGDGGENDTLFVDHRP